MNDPEPDARCHAFELLVLDPGAFAPARAAQLMAHAAGCDHCAQFLAAMRQPPAGAAAPDAVMRALGRVRGGLPPQPAAGEWTWPPSPATTFAAELVLAALGTGQPDGEPPTIELALPPGTDPDEVRVVVLAARASIRQPRAAFDDVALRAGASPMGAGQPGAAGLRLRHGGRQVTVLGDAADWRQWLAPALAVLLDESFTWSEACDVLRARGLEVELR